MQGESRARQSGGCGASSSQNVRRPQGTGSIIFTRGRYLPRLPLSLGRKPLTPCETYDDAAALLDATIAKLQERSILPTDAGETWATVARRWERLRVTDAGLRRSYGQAIERVSKAAWTRQPIDTVCRRDLLAWVDDRHRTRAYSKATTALDLAAVRQVFGFALDREITMSDPTVRVGIPKGWADPDAWTYLTKDELSHVLSCDAAPLRDRVIAAFLVGTGLRKGEWLSLRLTDVRPEGVAVRIGTETRAGTGPTKGRRARVVPMLPLTDRAWRVWLTLLPGHARRNPRSLAFPGPMGGRWKTWWEVDFAALLSACGITRPVRPHDLRHTCGAALVSGYYQDATGRPKRWPLVEVRDFLGHSSVRQTERYAHLADGHLATSAMESLDTVGHGLVPAGHAERELPMSTGGSVRAGHNSSLCP